MPCGPQVLLHLVLAVAAVNVKHGDGSRPPLAVNWKGDDWIKTFLLIRSVLPKFSAFL